LNNVKSKLSSFQSFNYLFTEEEIDSEAFLSLTENMIAKFLPTLGKQSKFNKKLMKLNEKINKEKVSYYKCNGNPSF